MSLSDIPEARKLQKELMKYIRPVVAKDPEKKRIEVHVTSDLKDTLVELAKADNRSLLNYIETLLERHVKELQKKGRR